MEIRETIFGKVLIDRQGVLHSFDLRDGVLTRDFHDLMLVGALCKDEPPKKVLALGVGGATNLRQLDKILTDWTWDGVDFNPHLPRMLQDKGWVPEAPGRFFTCDVVRFTDFHEIAPKYDLIFEDVYDVGQTHIFTKVDDWGQRLKRLLAPEGVVVMNVIMFQDLLRSAMKVAEVFKYRCAFMMGNKFNLSLVMSDHPLLEVEYLSNRILYVLGDSTVLDSVQKLRIEDAIQEQHGA